MQPNDHQQAICRRYGADYVEAPPADTLGIALTTMDGRQPLNALRHPPEGGACGWYVWAGEDFPTADDAFAPVHVAHVPQHCPALAPFLGLGPGWRVLLAPDYADVWYDSALLDV